MGQLLTFYDHGKDKTKIRYGHPAFQELASINQTWDWYFKLLITEWYTNGLKFLWNVEQIDFFLKQTTEGNCLNVFASVKQMQFFLNGRKIS